MNRLILATVVLMQTLIFSAQAGDADLAYFKQFLYREESVGNDPDFPEYQYRFLMSAFQDPYIPMADGRYLKARTEIQLFPDGTYKALYNEYIFETPDAMSFFPGICKVLTGKWSVPSTSLVLEGLGIAERIILNGAYGIRMTFSQNFNTPGLKGHASNFSYGYSMDSKLECFPF